MMDFVSEMMDFVSEMMDFVFKMMDVNGNVQLTADGALVLDSDRPNAAQLPWPTTPASETFMIGSGRAAPQCFGHSCTLITGPTDAAILYGVFRYLNLMRRDAPSTVGSATPASPLRMWDLWDNVDGTVERGYAGRSVFDWPSLPKLQPRYTDYARLLASVGINAIVWDNVNACGGGNQQLMSSAYILKLAPLAELFYQFGIRSFITPCFTSPMVLDHESCSKTIRFCIENV